MTAKVMSAKQIKPANAAEAIGRMHRELAADIVAIEAETAKLDALDADVASARFRASEHGPKSPAAKTYASKRDALRTQAERIMAKVGELKARNAALTKMVRREIAAAHAAADAEQMAMVQRFGGLVALACAQGPAGSGMSFLANVISDYQSCKNATERRREFQTVAATIRAVIAR